MTIDLVTGNLGESTPEKRRKYIDWIKWEYKGEYDFLMEKVQRQLRGELTINGDE